MLLKRNDEPVLSHIRIRHMCEKIVRICKNSSHMCRIYSRYRKIVVPTSLSQKNLYKCVTSRFVRICQPLIVKNDDKQFAQLPMLNEVIGHARYATNKRTES